MFLRFTRLFALLTLTIGWSAVMAQDTVRITYGRMTSALSPIQFQSGNSVNEVLYLSTEVGRSGLITDVALDKMDGPTTTILDGVIIRMRHSTLSTLATDLYDTAGYTTVFRGTLNNSTTLGWLPIALSQNFAYNGIDNLLIMFERRNGTPYTLAETSRFGYNTNSPNRNRRINAQLVPPIVGTSNLTSTNVQPNVALVMQGTTSSPALLGSTLMMYPNPAKGEVWLKLGNSEDITQAQVYNANGQIVKTLTLSSQTQRFDISDLAAGIYHIQLSHQGQAYSKRLVIN
jgi:hypothetical protein